jgi:hypothetical protein
VFSLVLSCTPFVSFRGQFGFETLHPTVGGSLIAKFESFMCAVWGGETPLGSLALCLPAITIVIIFLPLSICSSVCIFSTRHAPIQSNQSREWESIYSFTGQMLSVRRINYNIKACQVFQLSFE